MENLESQQSNVVTPTGVDSMRVDDVNSSPSAADLEAQRAAEAEAEEEARAVAEAHAEAQQRDDTKRRHEDQEDEAAKRKRAEADADSARAAAGEEARRRKEAEEEGHRMILEYEAAQRAAAEAEARLKQEEIIRQKQHEETLKAAEAALKAEQASQSAAKSAENAELLANARARLSDALEREKAHNAVQAETVAKNKEQAAADERDESLSAAQKETRQNQRDAAERALMLKARELERKRKDAKQDLEAAQKSIHEREEREQRQREEALRLLSPPPQSPSPAPQTAAPSSRISFAGDTKPGRSSPPRRGPALRLSGLRREEESTPQRIQHMPTEPAAVHLDDRAKYAHSVPGKQRGGEAEDSSKPTRIAALSKLLEHPSTPEDAAPKGNKNTNLRGMDAEFQDKVELTWDADFERKALQWISAMTGETIPPELPMYDALKSGVLLCRAANKIRPNLVPNIGTKALGMVERENIQQYLLACQKLGMQGSDLFTISDLHDRRYMPGVLHNIMALAKVAESLSNLGMMPKTPRTTAAVSRAKEVVEHAKSHRRAISMDVKPWELEHKLRVKADERASEAIERERQEMEANLARAEARRPKQPLRRSQTQPRMGGGRGRKKNSRPRRVVGLSKDTPIEKLMGVVATRLACQPSDLNSDLGTLRGMNMRTAGELYDLYDQIPEWNSLRLPLMVKIELEEVLPDVENEDDDSQSSERAPLVPKSTSASDYKSVVTLKEQVRAAPSPRRPASAAVPPPIVVADEPPVEKSRSCCIVM